MGEAVKTRIILILAILSAIFIFTTLTAGSNVSKYKSDLQNQIVARMTAEEKLDKALKEKLTWEVDVDNLKKQLEGEKAANDSLTKSLAQEQLINKSLREELEKINKLKDKLEENLKEALVAKPEKKSSTK